MAEAGGLREAPVSSTQTESSATSSHTLSSSIESSSSLCQTKPVAISESNQSSEFSSPVSASNTPSLDSLSLTHDTSTQVDGALTKNLIAYLDSEENKPSDRFTAFRFLEVIWGNIKHKPTAAKFRALKLDVVKQKIGGVRGGMESLVAMGFTPNKENTILRLPMEREMKTGDGILEAIRQYVKDKKLMPAPKKSVQFHAAEVVPEFLWLGGAHDAKNKAGLVGTNITHILNVANNVKNFFESDPRFTYLQLHVKDFGQDSGIGRVFEDAVRFVKAAQEKGGRVLVHCFAGINRSVTTVVALLMILNKITLKSAWKQVKAARPAAAPFHDNRQQLIEFEVRLLGSSSMTEDGFLYPDDE